ncbi:TPA: hypothetical protein ACM4XR_004543 [Escherichia coli]|jgi:hypothetical protein|uniref:hypothetical protein n=1 Tax=Escherichia coli TaxID=562 RepID=UPI0018AD5140|nr:hypothetical protein [Escherichia coli]DAO31751.1 MAG TPA: GROWTH FACTOR BOUND PROTEIN 2, SH3, SIGNAL TRANSDUCTION ADAPTOR.1A [Caudoviricetes sp.]HAM5207796.1 hypothetical protein [Escherichia coli]HDV7675335.1 hypothetical protein [Escherichia coli]
MQIIITDNTVIYEEDGDTLEKIGVNVGDVFNVLDSCEDGWWIKTGRYTIPVTKAEAKVYTTASNHDARADDSEGGCR